MSATWTPLTLTPSGLVEAGMWSFETIAVDVSHGKSVALDCACSPLAEFIPAFVVSVEESPNQIDWVVARASIDVDSGSRHSSVAAVTRRWLRVRIAWHREFDRPRTSGSPVEAWFDDVHGCLRVRLAGTRLAPPAELWCAGLLERRVA